MKMNICGKTCQINNFILQTLHFHIAWHTDIIIQDFKNHMTKFWLYCPPLTSNLHRFLLPECWQKAENHRTIKCWENETETKRRNSINLPNITLLWLTQTFSVTNSSSQMNKWTLCQWHLEILSSQALMVREEMRRVCVRGGREDERKTSIKHHENTWTHQLCHSHSDLHSSMSHC